MDAKLKSSVTASIFDTPLSAVLGKRLGVPFTRAQQEEICVYLHTSDTMEENYTVLILEQSGLGKFPLFSSYDALPTSIYSYTSTF